MVFTRGSSATASAGRIGGLVRASRYSSDELTGTARSAFLSRFEEQVDPDRILSETERLRRAGAAKKAFFARLALKSAQARRARRQNGGGK